MFPDMNDPDLTELLKRFALSAADQDAARKRAIATFGLGLLGARKGREGEAIGRAGLLGLQAKDDALAGMQAGKARDFQMAQLLAKQREQEAAKKAQADLQAGAAKAMEGSPYSAMGPGGPTPQNLSAFQEAAGPMGEVRKFRALSAFYGSKGMTEDAKRAADIAEAMEKRLEDEYGVSPTTGIGPDGKPVFVRFSKKGNKRLEEGVAPPPDLALVDTGGAKTYVDKLTTAPGTSFPVTMDPAQMDTSKRGWADLGLEREKFGYQKQKDKEGGGVKPSFHDGQWVYPPTPDAPQGKATPVAGYAGKPPENYAKQVAGITNLGTAVDEYISELGSWSNADLVNPGALAKMGTKYNNMMLQAKEAYNLGVLNGPDYMILTQTVTNPVSLKGSVTRNADLAAQAKALRDIMQKNKANLDAVYRQGGKSQGIAGGWSITEVK